MRMRRTAAPERGAVSARAVAQRSALMNELAADVTRSSATFAAGWDAAQVRPGSVGARHVALVVSVALHVGILMLMAAAWLAKKPLEEPAPRVRVTMFSRPQLPAVPKAAAPAAPKAATPPPRALPPPRPTLVEPELKPLPKPEPVSATAEPALPDAGAGAVTPEPAGESAGSEGPGAPGGSADGAGARGVLSGGVGAPPPAVSPERRKVVLDRYLQEIFRSRIAAKFHYPEEAERLGMEGLVVVRVAVTATGALWDARIISDCSQRLLCAAAERTVRDAAPFPPPPAELGGAISVDVPLQYRLE
jgi:periplasmic protein TonB